MTLNPGALDPLPVVTIDGKVIASGVAAAADAVPAELLVVDGLSVDWGRDEVIAQPDPATGRLQLFDPSGTWATSSDLRGKAVTLSWKVTTGGTTTQTVFFRGRVGSPVTVNRKTVQLADGRTIAGAVVDLPLVSVLVDLANIRPTAAWPEETVAARRTRISAAASAVVAGVTVRDYWLVPNMAPVAAKDQVSLWEHLVRLYDSTGADRLTYLPATNQVTYVVRRDYPTSRGHGRLWWDTTGARANTGAYLRATGNTVVYAHLAAGLTEYGDGITQPARMTRVELVHPSGATGPTGGFPERTVTRTVTGANEGRDGVRTVRLESQLSWDNYADTAASDLEDYVQKEGGAWQLDPIRWSSKRAGGFDDLAQIQWLLSGAEAVDSAPGFLVFLQGTWLPAFGLRPVFGIMGGTIGYRRGGWEVDLQIAPMTTASLQHPITFEEIDDGSATYELQWWDDDHPRGLHPSVTFEDLGYCARGLGTDATAVIGPDQGWDFRQP